MKKHPEIQIPYHPLRYIHPELRDEMLHTFARVYDSEWYILGENLLEFEKAYAEYVECHYALGVGSGLDALMIALKCLDIGPGDEVIVPANSFIATALAVHHCGAIPVFADPDPYSYNLSTQGIEKALTRSTKAVIPVHLYGNPAPIDDICRICEFHGLYVVEDNAQAHGARHHGHRTGSFGHMSATSFYPVKNHGALGDGGMITTDSHFLYEKAARLRNYGGVQKDHWELPGYNSRLDELQAALLMVKLRHLDRWNSERRTIASRYLEQLRGVGDLQLPVYAAQDEAVCHVFPVVTGLRDKLRQYLMSRGVDTLIHYPVPIHMQPAFRHLKLPEGCLPISEKLSRTELSLPIYPGLKDYEIAYVSESVRDFFKNH